jgi:hypothetical protein
MCLKCSAKTTEEMRVKEREGRGEGLAAASGCLYMREAAAVWHDGRPKRCAIWRLGP